eukprot:jgi/Botrbrau1/8527/Bobra.0029s0031.1
MSASESLAGPFIPHPEEPENRRQVLPPLILPEALLKQLVTARGNSARQLLHSTSRSVTGSAGPVRTTVERTRRNPPLKCSPLLQQPRGGPGPTRRGGGGGSQSTPCQHSGPLTPAPYRGSRHVERVSPSYKNGAGTGNYAIGNGHLSRPVPRPRQERQEPTTPSLGSRLPSWHMRLPLIFAMLVYVSIILHLMPFLVASGHHCRAGSG